MDRILHYLRPLIRLNCSHPFLVLMVALLLAAGTAFFAVQLRVDTDLTNLLPRDNEHVQALNSLQQTVGGETAMEVVIQSPEFEDNLAFAQDLIRESLQLYDPGTDNYFLERAEFRKNVEVIKNNALYFATPRELEDITGYLRNEIQSAKEDINPFYFDLEEEEEDSEQQQRLDQFEESYDALIPTEYPVSPDSTVMVVKFYPTGSKSNLSYLRELFASYDSLLASMDIQSYHPEMEVEFGGRLKRHLEEIDSIMGDVFRSFASGISTVIILVMIYFFVKKYIHYRRGSSRGKQHSIWGHLLRMPVPVMVIGIPLVISLSWTFGITYGVLGILNTMTSVLFVILFGMGIDYGIHFYARYIEFRSSGQDIESSIYSTYDKTGSAIVVSGLTTAFSLFVLMLAQFRGFSEFGFIAGTGIILALFCMLFVLPSLLVIFERFNWILLNEKDGTHQSSPTTASRFPFARTILVAGIAVATVVLFRTDALQFQYDFGELEPEFPEYEQFREMTGEVDYSDKRNPAYILADTQEETIEILEVLRHRMRTDTTSPTILDVEALPERFPSTGEAAEQKLQEISLIRELLNDPVIEGQDDPQLERLRRAAQTTEPMQIDDIPEYFKEQFVTRSGEVGNFVIVYPSVRMADGENSIAFKEDVGSVTLDNGKTFHAASTSIIAAEMLELMRSESPWMIGATFIVVFLLMLFSFNSFRWTLIAMLPLVVGLLWLFGIMVFTGLMFNFYNLVVLPAILGIGEDNGVHLAARYREEGRNSMWDVLSSTGQHVTIGSLTTMLGFSGLLFTNHPGLQSIGMMAVLGIGMTLLAALTFLPALIQVLEDRDWIRFE